FLDEISTMDDRVQVALLRALQSNTFRPVGAREDLRSDVRIVAATNTNLRESVRRGQFRQDLMHRLEVFRIDIPPLRQRRKDVPMLAQSFLEEVREEYGFKISAFTNDAMAAIRNY